MGNHGRLGERGAPEPASQRRTGTRITLATAPQRTQRTRQRKGNPGARGGGRGWYFLPAAGSLKPLLHTRRHHLRLHSVDHRSCRSSMSTLRLPALSVQAYLRMRFTWMTQIAAFTLKWARGMGTGEMILAMTAALVLVPRKSHNSPPAHLPLPLLAEGTLGLI